MNEVNGFAPVAGENQSVRFVVTVFVVLPSKFDPTCAHKGISIFRASASLTCKIEVKVHQSQLVGLLHEILHGCARQSRWYLLILSHFTLSSFPSRTPSHPFPLYSFRITCNALCGHFGCAGSQSRLTLC